MTCQRLEVRVRQHISRSLLSGRLISRHSQAMDSAININAEIVMKMIVFLSSTGPRNKGHLKFLEAIHIYMNRPLSVLAVKQSYA